MEILCTSVDIYTTGLEKVKFFGLVYLVCLVHFTSDKCTLLRVGRSVLLVVKHTSRLLSRPPLSVTADPPWGAPFEALPGETLLDTCSEHLF